MKIKIWLDIYLKRYLNYATKQTLKVSCCQKRFIFLNIQKVIFQESLTFLRKQMLQILACLTEFCLNAQNRFSSFIYRNLIFKQWFSFIISYIKLVLFDKEKEVYVYLCWLYLLCNQNGIGIYCSHFRFNVSRSFWILIL